MSTTLTKRQAHMLGQAAHRGASSDAPRPPTPTAQYIPLADIRTNGGTQARAQLDEATLAEYEETWRSLSHQQNGFDRMPPITVYYDGSAYWLADGFHRVEAYTRFVNGRDASASQRGLMAEVRQGTLRDAVLYACGANAAHGLRRTNADKRRAVETLLRDAEWRGWSDSEIARRCVVDHKTVASVRADLESTGEIPSSTVRQGADGKTRDVSGIQAANEARAQPTADEVAQMRERFYALGYEQFYASDAGWTTYHPKTKKANYKTWAAVEADIARKEAMAAAKICENCGGPWGRPGSIVTSEGRLCPDCGAARLSSGQPIAPVPEPIIRVEDAELFERADLTCSIGDGYLSRGKIKRPFEYAGKLWISVGGSYGGAYSAHDVCECVRVVLEGELYTPGERNKSFREGSHTHDRASAGGKNYVLTGQWLIVTRPNANYKPTTQTGDRGAINRPDGSPAPAAPDQALVATIREKAAALGLQLIWEDGKVIMYWPDEADDLEQMDLLPYEVALEWLEGDGLSIAAARAEQDARMEPITDPGPHLPPPVEYKAAQQRAAALGLRIDMNASGAFAFYRLSGGGVHGGAVNWAATLDLLARKEADRLRHLIEQAEQLGAAINPTAYDDPRVVQVVPPQGYQQAPLKCDAADLARLVERWSGEESAQPALDKRASLYRHWKAAEEALDRADQTAAEQAIRAMYRAVHGPCAIVVLPPDAIEPDALAASIRAITAGVHAERAEPGLAILRAMLKQSESGVGA